MLLTVDYINGDDVELGEIVTSVVVSAANVLKDLRENITNLVGGRMVHYERLIEKAIVKSLEELEEKGRARGYDGVLGVKIAHPYVVNGAVEVIAYGTGFKYRRKRSEGK